MAHARERFAGCFGAMRRTFAERMRLWEEFIAWLTSPSKRALIAENALLKRALVRCVALIENEAEFEMEETGVPIFVEIRAEMKEILMKVSV